MLHLFFVFDIYGKNIRNWNGRHLEQKRNQKRQMGDKVEGTIKKMRTNNGAR
jgi:hypothetical protein